MHSIDDLPIGDENSVEIAALLMRVAGRAIDKNDHETLQDLSSLASVLFVVNKRTSGEFIFFFDLAEYLYETGASIKDGNNPADNLWGKQAEGDIRDGLRRARDLYPDVVDESVS